MTTQNFQHANKSGKPVYQQKQNNNNKKKKREDKHTDKKPEVPCYIKYKKWHFDEQLIFVKEYYHCN